MQLACLAQSPSKTSTICAIDAPTNVQTISHLKVTFNNVKPLIKLQLSSALWRYKNFVLLLLLLLLLLFYDDDFFISNKL